MPTTPNYSQPAIFSEVATPTVPDSGYLKVYANSGVLASIANGGSEKRYVAISGSGLPIGAYTLPTTDGTSSQVLQTNGSGTVTWQTVSGGGGGITSINGDTTAAQLLTVGTAGTNFAIDSTTTPGTSVFNLPDASATARGLVTTGTQTFAGTKTLAGDLLFTDATYDIGKSGATRPRDGFFSRNLTYSGQLMVPVGSQYAASIQNSQFGTGTGINFTAAGTYFLDNNSAVIHVGVGGQNKLVLGCDLRFASSIGATEDLYVVRSAADTLALRRSTNAQAFQIHETWSSSTSFGALQFKANTGAAYQIGSAIGSAGGSNRAIEIGHYSSAGTFTSALSIATSGTLSASAPLSFAAAGYIDLSSTTYSRSNVAIRMNYGSGTPGGIYGSNGNVGFSAASSFFFDAVQTRCCVPNSSGYAIGGTTSPSHHVMLASPSSGVMEINSGTPGAYRDLLVRNLTSNSETITQVVATTGSPTAFTVTGAAHTTLTLSTEATDVNFNLARTVQFATGALTTQRAVRIQAPTYAFVGASTITNATTLELSPPVAGTNATITNTSALVVNFADTANTKAVRIVGPGTGGTVWTAFDIANGATNYFKVNVYGVYAQTFEEAATTNTFSILSGKTFNLFSGNTHITGDSSGLYIQPQVGHNTQLRSGTNVQSLGVYGTYTSSTSYERVNIRGKASANFEIGPENGSAGGTLRGLTIGGYSAGTTTIAPWLTFTSSGTPTFNLGTLVIPSGGTGLLCQQTNIYLDSYGTHSGIRYRRSEGTQGSPTGVALNSLLGFVATYGYHTGSAYHSTQGASISFYATEAFTSGAQGSKIVFGTTPNGTTTNTVALTIDQNQVATFSKLVAQSAAEITSTPSGTTQTITLNNGNHQTLTLTSATGAVTVTLTVPSNVSSGTIIVKQHASVVRNITWAVSAGTIKWMGTQPTWSSDAVSDIRIVSWRYDGSVMYLMSTDKAA